MKITISKSTQSIIYLSLLLVNYFLISSCNDPTKSEARSGKDSMSSSISTQQMAPKTKISFFTMGMSVPEFLKIVGKKKFKRIICQFQNKGLDTTKDRFEYDVVSYAWRKGLGAPTEYFDSSIMKATRNQYDSFVPPYRIGNIELRDGVIEDFIDELRRTGKAIEQFDSVLFIPIKDSRYGSYFINLEVVAIDSAEVLKSLLVTKATFNPCPPAKPD